MSSLSGASLLPHSEYPPPSAQGALLTWGFQGLRLADATAQNVFPPSLQQEGGSRSIAHWLGKRPRGDTQGTELTVLEASPRACPSSGVVRRTLQEDLRLDHAALSGQRGLGWGAGRGP